MNMWGSTSASQPRSTGAYGDVSYEIDLVAEAAMIGEVRKRLPECCIISEEAGVIGRRDAMTVILMDPLDGSTNAVRGVPLFSSAIAAAKGPSFDDIVAAGVQDLVHGDMLIGSSRGGVMYDGRPCKPSQVVELEEAYVSVDLKPQGHGTEDWTRMLDMFRRTKYLRFLGSAAWEIALVAAGSVEAFVEPLPRLRTFDCLPSLFLVKEAGGFVRFLEPAESPPSLFSSDRIAFIASGTRAIGEVILSGLRPGRRNLTGNQV